MELNCKQQTGTYDKIDPLILLQLFDKDLIWSYEDFDLILLTELIFWLGYMSDEINNVVDWLIKEDLTLEQELCSKLFEEHWPLKSKLILCLMKDEFEALEGKFDVDELFSMELCSEISFVEECFRQMQQLMELISKLSCLELIGKPDSKYIHDDEKDFEQRDEIKDAFICCLDETEQIPDNLDAYEEWLETIFSVEVKAEDMMKLFIKEWKEEREDNSIVEEKENFSVEDWGELHSLLDTEYRYECSLDEYSKELNLFMENEVDNENKEYHIDLLASEEKKILPWEFEIEELLGDIFCELLPVIETILLCIDEEGYM